MGCVERMRGESIRKRLRLIFGPFAFGLSPRSPQRNRTTPSRGRPLATNSPLPTSPATPPHPHTRICTHRTASSHRRHIPTFISGQLGACSALVLWRFYNSIIRATLMLPFHSQSLQQEVLQGWTVQFSSSGCRYVPFYHLIVRLGATTSTISSRIMVLRLAITF